MGIYIDPPVAIFKELTGSDYFVDKSEIIAFTNKALGSEKKFICISRPRRFGKTLTAKMLCAYYELGINTQDIFDRLKISKSNSYLSNLNRHHVIFINMTDEFNSHHKKVDIILKELDRLIISELKELYHDFKIDTKEDLQLALRIINSKTTDRFIVIIDEWDCILREAKQDLEGQRLYLEWLKRILKDKEYIALAYMTGILPIKKYGTQSALNMFLEYSMTAPGQYAPFIGFNSDEVEQLCKTHHMKFEEMQRWYDGYSFENIPHIYNPNSVVTAILNKQFGSYWSQTETFRILQQYINLNFDGLKEDIVSLIAGSRIVVSFTKFQNDLSSFKSKDDVLTLLIHLGYLAITQNKDLVIDDSRQCIVKIPNLEIRSEFINSVSDNNEYAGIYELIDQTNDLLQSIWTKNSSKVAELFDRAHSKNTSILKYNDENSLACVITLSLLLSNRFYSVKRELPSGLGFADMIYLPRKGIDKPALLIELKYDSNAGSALRQIKEKRYVDFFDDYHGRILLIGINYDKKSKKDSCLIEEISV